jgi:hypothetical protein
VRPEGLGKLMKIIHLDTRLSGGDVYMRVDTSPVISLLLSLVLGLYTAVVICHGFSSD